jgi:hypothetical protein
MNEHEPTTAPNGLLSTAKDETDRFVDVDVDIAYY